jgi:PAS domain S-box-containing protein/putative nucleotidyltransferase with HDIG domain
MNSGHHEEIILADCRQDVELPEESIALRALLRSAAVQDALEAFHDLDATSVSIADCFGNTLISSRCQRICTQFHRTHPVSCARCMENHRRLRAELDSGKPYAIRQCGNGLTTAAAPLVIDGIHVANLHVGQFVTEPTDDRSFTRRGEELGLDLADYLGAVHEVPVIEEERVRDLLGFLGRMCRLTTGLAIHGQRAAESVARQTAILNTMPQAVFWKGLDGTYLGCNTAFAASVGAAGPEEIVGKTDLDLPALRESAAIAAEEEQAIITSVKPRLHVIESVRRPDGRRVLADTSKLPLMGGDRPFGVLGVYEDMSDERAAEEALRESEAKFRALSDHSLVGIYIVQDGRFTYVNSAFAAAFGYAPEELAGAESMIVVHPSDRERVMRNMWERLAGKPVPSRYELLGLHRNGEARHGEMFAAATVLGNRPAIIGNILDITDRKQAQHSLQDAYEGLTKTLDDTVVTMAKIVEMRDPYTAGHQQRVANLAVAIAGEIGMDQERIGELRMAAVIHDIGKMSIPAEIVTKPGRLTHIELQLMMTHAQSGYDIVRNMNHLPRVAQTILQHHERIDGSGYPNGLRGDDILLEARVIAVADVVEAMASHRPYRSARGIDVALAEITQNSGTQYDRDACDACLKLFNERGFVLETDDPIRGISEIVDTKPPLNHRPE